MFIKTLWPWWLISMALAEGEFPGTMQEPSVLRVVQEQRSSDNKARSLWTYQIHEDISHSQPFEGISHGYAAHPQEQTFRTTEPHSEYTTYSESSLPEHWNPSSANLTFVNGNPYSYSRPHLAPTTVGSGPLHRDALRVTHSPYQYYPNRPSVSAQPPYKKILPHYHIAKFQLQSADGFAKTNHKKTLLYHSPSIPSTHKEPPHFKVHKPYAKHKYPIHKTPHHLYRRYYQSPYQKYAIPFADPLHLNKLAPQNNYPRYKTTSSSSSSSPTLSADGYRTTERMDDAYSDGSPLADDYSHYNTTTTYYDTDDEPRKPPPSTLHSQVASHDETTTRGYYGDRIYMSTHFPLHSPLDKPADANTNAYFILRRTSEDYDIFD